MFKEVISQKMKSGREPMFMKFTILAMFYIILKWQACYNDGERLFED
jgi:hypothetical protein